MDGTQLKLHMLCCVCVRREVGMINNIQVIITRTVLSLSLKP